MATYDFQYILRKALNEPKFKRRLLKNPQETLKEEKIEYELTPAEIDILMDIDEMVKKAGTKRWSDISFKEKGAVALSIVLIFFIMTGTIMAYVFITDDGSAFERAKDLLNLFFPLFTGIVSFWTGISLQNRTTENTRLEAENARLEARRASDETNRLAREAQERLLYNKQLEVELETKNRILSRLEKKFKQMNIILNDIQESGAADNTEGSDFRMENRTLNVTKLAGEIGGIIEVIKS